MSDYGKEKVRAGIIKNAVIVFGIIVTLFAMDFLCVYFTDKPIIYTRKEEATKDNYRVYHGFFYKTYNCDGLVKIEPLDSEYYCGYIPEDSGFKIIDTEESCPEYLEKIHETFLYSYYLPCIKSNKIKIVFDDGKTYTLREVLNQKLLTIEELMENGLKVKKEKRL